MNRRFVRELIRTQGSSRLPSKTSPRFRQAGRQDPIFGTAGREDLTDTYNVASLQHLFSFHWAKEIKMIQRTMFVLAVNDLLRSAQYYQDQLGFEVREIGDDGWRIFERDGCRIMAGDCPDAIPPAQMGDHSYFAYVVVDDADKFFEEFNHKQIDFVKTIKSEPWGMREFGLQTIDGHRIMFGQEL